MLERLIYQIQRPILYLVAKSGFLCSVYYALCSGSFRREHRGVVCARLKYTKQARNPSGCQYLLRRNIHLVEKGLLVRPEGDVFGLDYIQETVACYGRALQDGRTSPELACRTELQWASDVLTRYFEVSGPHPIIDKLRDRFRTLQATVAERAPTAVPHERGLAGPPPVKYEELLELAPPPAAVRRRSLAATNGATAQAAIDIAAPRPAWEDGPGTQIIGFIPFPPPDEPSRGLLLSRRATQCRLSTGAHQRQRLLAPTLDGEVRKCSTQTAKA